MPRALDSSPWRIGISTFGVFGSRPSRATTALPERRLARLILRTAPMGRCVCPRCVPRTREKRFGLLHQNLTKSAVLVQWASGPKSPTLFDATIRFTGLSRSSQVMACSQEDLLFLLGAIGMRLILWGTLGARSQPSGVFGIPLRQKSRFCADSATPETPRIVGDSQ